MAGSGGATRQQQLQGHGAAHDIGGTDHHRMQAVGLDPGRLDQGHDALGGAGAQGRDALGQAAHVVGMETIHILVGTNALEQLGGIAMGRQGQLHQNAVHLAIFIEPVDQGQQLFLTRVDTQIVRAGDKAHLFTGTTLAADIDLGRRIHPHQDHRQSRGPFAQRDALLDLCGDLAANRLRNLFSINDFGRHRSSLILCSTARIVAFFWRGC